MAEGNYPEGIQRSHLKKLLKPLVSILSAAPTFQSNLLLYYQNVRGIKSKLIDFYAGVLNNDFDVYVLTETWLNEILFLIVKFFLLIMLFIELTDLLVTAYNLPEGEF